jgi:uncharacterized protein YkwD
VTSPRLPRKAALLVLSLALGAPVLAPSVATAATHRSGCAHRASYRQGSGGRRRCVRRHRRRHHAPRAGASCRNANLRPNPSDLVLIRHAVLCLVNRERTRRGEASLRLNGRLGRAAQQHSESMASGGYVSHFGPRGQSPLARIRATGYLARHGSFAIGENIAWGTLGLSTPRAIVAAWMRSPEHRANILDARFRASAVGVAVLPPSSRTAGQPGGIYTEDFGSLGGHGRSQRTS